MMRSKCDMQPPAGPSTRSQRRRLLARTALCGVLAGLTWINADPARALPDGGIAEVNAGGGLPVITSTVGSTTVNLNAPRTVLSWITYNLNPDETVTYNFGARNWIVLNKVIGLQQSKIEGTVVGKVGSDFGGNIWFVSNNGIIFGAGSHIDAGSIVAAIGTPDTRGFLDPTNNL